MKGWFEVGLIVFATTLVTLSAYWRWIQAANWRLDRRTRSRKHRAHR